MVSKPKAAPAASSSKAVPSTPAPAPAQTPSAPQAPAPAFNAHNAPATPSPAPAQAQASGERFNDPSALTMGGEREAAIANMESMGFARADIDRAMRAAFFNPDRAVEYLLTVRRVAHRSGRLCSNLLLGHPGERTTRAGATSTSPCAQLAHACWRKHGCGTCASQSLWR
jgi:hypothetical protein